MTAFLIIVFLIMMIPTGILGMYICHSDCRMELSVIVLEFFLMFLIPAVPTFFVGWLIWERLV